jgi:hypothetical protein
MILWNSKVYLNPTPCDKNTKLTLFQVMVNLF